MKAETKKMTLAQELRDYSMQWDGTDAPILIALRRAAAALEEKDAALLLAEADLVKRATSDAGAPTYLFDAVRAALRAGEAS